LIFISLFSYGKRLKVAVLPFEKVGVSSDNAKSITEIFTTKLVNSGYFDVVERNRLESLITEKKLQLSGLVAIDKAVRAGKILAVDKIIIGTVNKLVEEIFLNVSVIEVNNTKIEYADKYIYSSDLEFVSETEFLAGRVIGKMVGQKPILTQKIYPYKWYGIGSLALSASTLVAGIYFNSQLKSNLNERNSSMDMTKREEYDNNAKKYRDYRLFSYISAGVFAVTGTGLLLISKDVPANIQGTSQATIYIDDKNLFLSLSLNF